MDSILTILLTFLSTNSVPITSCLLKGLTEEEVKGRLHKVIKTAPSDLVELYKWKNGTNFPKDSKPLFDYNFHIYNLNDAIEDFEAFQKLDPKDYFGLSFKNLFPIFLSGGGEYYFYCFSGPQNGKVLYHSPAEFGGEIVLAFDSLEKMFNSIYECYRQNIYYTDENSRLRVKSKEHSDLMKKLNPDCIKWNDEEIDSELMLIDLGK